MLDITFHIAVLLIVVFAVGLFVFHHSFYDYLLGNMKGAVKERLPVASDNRGGTMSSAQPTKCIERRESEIEKALKENLDEPVGSATSLGTK